MFIDIDLLSFLFGTMYGIIVLATMHTWNMLVSWEFIKHDNTKGKHGTDTFEHKRVSLSRACMIGIASLVWPLTLVLSILYGVFCLPFVLYRKSAS